MYQATYIRAGSLAEAENLLTNNPEAKLISGGQTLVPTLRQRLARASHLVDIVHLPELRGLTQDGEAVVVGASTTHAEVAASDLVRSRIPIVHQGIRYRRQRIERRMSKTEIVDLPFIEKPSRLGSP